MGRPHVKNPDGLITLIATEWGDGEMGICQTPAPGALGPPCSGHMAPATDGFSGGTKVATYSVIEPLHHPMGDLGPFW